MMKRIWILGSAAAALAVSATLVAAPALAQGAPGMKDAPVAELYGGPGYRGPEPVSGRHDYRGDPRGRGPGFDRSVMQCSRAGIEQAWSRGYYSAQYDSSPRLVNGRRGWEMHGRMKLHDRRGFVMQNTICDLGGRNARIDFVR